MEDKSFNFDNLIEELKSNGDTIDIDRFSIKELTLEQQRKIINAGLGDISTRAASLNNIYNDYINQNVLLKDDMIKSGDVITLAQKPYFLMLLRTVSFGKTFESEGKQYNLKVPNESEILKAIVPDEIIKFGDFEIGLHVPTLNVDVFYNDLIIKSFKNTKIKDISEEVLINITNKYQVYEMMKFIDYIKFKDEKYNFIEIVEEHKVKFIESLPQKPVNRILDYIKKCNDFTSKALVAIDKSKNTHIIDSFSIFASTPIIQ